MNMNGRPYRSAIAGESKINPSTPAPQTNTEVKDNIASDSTAFIVDLLGEGPIEGPAFGASDDSIDKRLRLSTYIDDTPIRSAGQTTDNLQGVSLELRYGDPDQAALTLDTDIEADNVVGIEVTPTTPLVRQITDTDVDKVRFTVRINGLYSVNTSTGNISGTSVEWVVGYRSVGDGGPWVEQTVLVTGKTRSPLDKSIEMTLTGSAPWDIQVRRTTNYALSSSNQNQIYWTLYNEIKSHRMMYPDCAIIGMSAKASSFGGSIPRRSYRVRGLRIKVPSNYDPIEHTYESPAIWDGTFKIAWTNNPAWIYYDLLTNKRYGLGERIAESTVDKWALYVIGKYCDELVDDGYGGLEPRFTFNGVITSRQEAYRVLQTIASCFRGMSYWGAGTVIPIADMPADPICLVTNSDVVDGVFSYEGSSLKSRHTAVLVAWQNPDDLFKSALEFVDDPDGIASIGYRPAEVQAIGCTSRGLARRIGKWLIETEKSEREVVNFSVGIKLAGLRPGDVIMVSDKYYAGVRMGGRILDVMTSGSPPVLTGIKLDSAFSFSVAQSYSAAYQRIDGTMARVDVVNPADADNETVSTDELSFTEEQDSIPIAGASWAIFASDVQPRPFRVISVRDSGNDQLEVSALEYNAGKYAKVESNLTFDEPPFTKLPTGELAIPSNIVTHEELFLSGGVTPRSRLDISWSSSPDKRATYYEVQLQSPTKPWETVAKTTLHAIEVLDIEAATYSIRLRAIDGGTNRASSWVQIDNVAVLGMLVPPDDVASFSAAVVGDTITLNWTACSAINLDHYEIRWSPNTTPGAVTWNAAGTINDALQQTSFSAPLLPGTYLIKAVTMQGVASRNATIIVSNVSSTYNSNAVEQYVEHPLFAGTKTGVIRVGSAIELDYADDFYGRGDFYSVLDFYNQGAGFLAEGSYEFATSYLDLGDVYTSRVAVSYTAVGLSAYEDVFQRLDFFAPTDFFMADPDDWRVFVEIATTDDDPAGTPTWSDWAPIGVANLTFRACKFRAILVAYRNGVTPHVTELSAIVDMPDRLISGSDLVCPVSGLTVVFDPPFLGYSGMSRNDQDMQTGDYAVVTGAGVNGFSIIYRNSSGAAVQRTFDYVARGYGLKIA